jgi:hydroxymethylglutaryl-CoA reductase
LESNKNISNKKTITGFSKLSKRGKIKWMVENFFKDPENVMHELMSYWHRNEDQQKILDGFSENTLTNFPLPFSVAPNFLINNKAYCVPMVIEESSVVAAAASAAKFWMDRGGIHAKVLDTKKFGQIHFSWNGDPEKLKRLLPELRMKMLDNASDLMRNMVQRGGGVGEIELKRIDDIPDYYQFLIAFNTCDSMGANFINSCLESFSNTLEQFITQTEALHDDEREFEIIMSILSNYTPECLVKTWVTCPIEQLGDFNGNLNAREFAEKFFTAVQIAKLDPYRAVTHNKGIFNGIDAVVLATANDFRAVEACGHAYAARSGSYSSLSDCTIENDVFHFSLEIPLALGTVGGLTALHPMAKRSLELLENPTAEELMMITAATGLAQNFAAIRSLITTGIQFGHMKMHLANILQHLKASDMETKSAKEYFVDKKVSFNSVRNYLESLRYNPV